MAVGEFHAGGSVPESRSITVRKGLIEPGLEQWARRLLDECTLPLAADIHRVWLVELAAICFTATTTKHGYARARTALLEQTKDGAQIKTIVTGWPVPNEPPGGTK